MYKNILNIIDGLAQENRVKIAIGAGTETIGRENVLKAADAASDFADITIVSGEDAETRLVELLRSGEVDGAVRGSLKAAVVMKNLRAVFTADKLGRIALLSTSEDVEFFLAPVGVDEGNSFDEKCFLVEAGTRLLHALGIQAKIGVLSGGRADDIGRHPSVDKSNLDAEKLVTQFKDQFEIKHYHILVEEAVEDGANIIIAPNGITGNLMFRSLAFLGSGQGYGAPIVGLEKIFVDTSRAERPVEYLAALKIAAALVNRNHSLGR